MKNKIKFKICFVANFPADHAKLADHPQPSTNWTSTSSTTPPPPATAPLPLMPPSILVIALNEQQQPSAQQLPWNDDHFAGSSISLQKILATLQHQRAFPRAEPLPGANFFIIEFLFFKLKKIKTNLKIILNYL